MCVCSNWASQSSERWLVVANLSGDAVELPAEVQVSGGVTLLSTVSGEQGSTAQPWEARVLRIARPWPSAKATAS